MSTPGGLVLGAILGLVNGLAVAAALVLLGHGEHAPAASGAAAACSCLGAIVTAGVRDRRAA